MPVYNSQPRPRVLLEALPPEVAEELTALVPTAHIVKEGEEVHEAEYDLLVTCSSDAGRRSEHMHVLSFGPKYLDAWPRDSGTGGYVHPERNNRTLASEVHIPPTVDTEARALLEQTVVANITVGEKFTWSRLGSRETTSLLELGKERYLYALLWPRTRKEGSAMSLVLPPETTNHRAWFVWFLRLLNKIDPDTFPGDPNWTLSPEWSTAETLVVHDQLTKVHEKRSKLLAELDEREKAVASKLEDARAADKVGFQRLLTADGDELESAVQEVLTEIGFTVQNMDGHHDHVTKAKLEDLRVSDPEDPDWIALVEIKGYMKGARTNDVAQILGRPMRAYILEAGREPSTVWHIVNHERAVDPSTRNDAVPNDLDLEGITDAGGALIESRQLFLALRDLQSGNIDAATIRHSLKNARTRWDYRKA
ncbi:hypothetical protein IRJ34_15250 [Paenarthrobacter sp. GOM3]|uniref:hypothetical protein n=1 Tax=Paenarthrobacter sp. GOM3 TaxID=2782567 RepID=UPI001BAD3AB2|nr:hypothetical protein [Paenarthrobacter sp. GOM3]WOH17691.1 hypothetical protein IRJ34_15250 [Paenarthrobacter sp. GOM3]